jgi:hypothetical protein
LTLSSASASAHSRLGAGRIRGPAVRWGEASKVRGTLTIGDGFQFGPDLASHLKPIMGTHLSIYIYIYITKDQGNVNRGKHNVGMF